MSELPFSPRNSKSRSTKIIEFRNISSLQVFVEKFFGGLNSLVRILESARNTGGAYFVIEKINTSACIESENELMRKRWKLHKMTGLVRLTFWEGPLEISSTPHVSSSKKFVGYAILRENSFGKTDSKWHIYESILRPPFDRNVILPHLNTFSVNCADHEYWIEGSLYSEQDRLKGCGHTSLRTICSMALNRDVSFCEILDANPKKKSNGMLLREIENVFTGLDIECRSIDFTFKEGKNLLKIEPIGEMILPSLTTGFGLLLGFKLNDNELFHLVPIYGYTIDPLSIDHFQNKHYFNSKSKNNPTSMYDWVQSFICNDDNYGPYCHIQKHSKMLKNSVAIVYANSVKNSVNSLIIQMSSYAIVGDVLAQSGDQKLREAWHKGELILHPRLMAGKDYVSYLSSTKDVVGNIEDRNIVGLFKSEFGEESIWVIEISSEKMIPEMIKLGELIIRVEIENGKNSSNYKSLWRQFVFLRLPKKYYFGSANITGNSRFVAIKSSFKAGTPFIQNGKSRENYLIRKNEEEDRLIKYLKEVVLDTNSVAPFELIKDSQSKWVLEQITKEDKPEIHILDFGCGEMRLKNATDAIKSPRILISYVGTDLVRPKVLKRVKSLRNLFVRPEDLKKYPNNHFDFVVMQNIFHELEILHSADAVETVRRLLKNEGLLLIVDMGILPEGELHSVPLYPSEFQSIFLGSADSSFNSKSGIPISAFKIRRQQIPQFGIYISRLRDILERKRDLFTELGSKLPKSNETSVIRYELEKLHLNKGVLYDLGYLMLIAGFCNNRIKNMDSELKAIEKIDIDKAAAEIVNYHHGFFQERGTQPKCGELWDHVGQYHTYPSISFALQVMSQVPGLFWPMTNWDATLQATDMMNIFDDHFKYSDIQSIGLDEVMLKCRELDI